MGIPIGARWPGIKKVLENGARSRDNAGLLGRAPPNSRRPADVEAVTSRLVSTARVWLRLASESPRVMSLEARRWLEVTQWDGPGWIGPETASETRNARRASAE